jgi:hypothetical protein
MSRPFRLLDALRLLTPALLALAACGGGGGDGAGGGDPNPPGDPPPVGGVAIAGNLLSASVSQADSDVNDPNAPFRGNDTRAEAQPIPAPVALGGYVNQPGRGPGGRSFTGTRSTPSAPRSRPAATLAGSSSSRTRARSASR